MDIHRPKLSVSIAWDCYKFVLWARHRGQFTASKSAIVEQALRDLAGKMGYPTSEPIDMVRQSETADVI